METKLSILLFYTKQRKEEVKGRIQLGTAVRQEKQKDTKLDQI